MHRNTNIQRVCLNDLIAWRRCFSTINMELSDATNILLENIKSISTSEDEIETIIKVLTDPNIQKSFQIYSALEDTSPRQCCIKENKEVVKALQEVSEDPKTSELLNILTKPHFRALMEAQETIAQQNYLSNLPSDLPGPTLKVVRMNNLDKNKPLGLHLSKHTDGCVFIEDINGQVESQELFTIGDIVQEIDGKPVGSDLKQLQQQMMDSQSIKLLTSPKSDMCQVFMKCHFDYSSCFEDFPGNQEMGLHFKRGDILQIFDQSNANVWQAARIEENGDIGKLGWIPSLKAQQKKKSNLEPFNSALLTKKKKLVYRRKTCSLFDGLRHLLYEEVEKMPPFYRKLILLIGSEHSVTKALIQRLAKELPHIYASTVPETSRKPVGNELSEGGYRFLSRDTMVRKIRGGEYYEFGEYKNNYYATAVQSVRDVVRSKKTCVVDCNPVALKFLRTAEFMPLVVHVGPSNKTEASEILEQMYSCYFDLSINHSEDTYETLLRHIEENRSRDQWIPVHWVY